MRSKTIALALTATLIIVTSALVAEGSHFRIFLIDDGRILFFESGLFNDTLYPVKLIGGEWHWISGATANLVAVPYEAEGNFKYGGHTAHVVLQAHGGIYFWTQRREEKHPVKLIDEEWKFYEGGEWYSLFTPGWDE